MKEKILEMVRQSAASQKPYGWLNYQPINLPGYEETIPLRGRDCFDRAKALFPHLKEKLGEGPLSIADWGSNIGFFVFEAAKLGHMASGYDSDRRLIDACRYLASTGEFRFTPSFHQQRMSPETVKAAPRVDVIFCFSVLHHMKGQEQIRTIEAIASNCAGAYVEMDGVHFGRKALETFFWKVDAVVETNDRYGNGRLRRKTWYCTNRDGDRTFRNLKEKDFVHDRGLFLCSRPNAPTSVFKRERATEAPYLHTWLKTGLPHEREMYEKYPSPFFPKLLGAGLDEFRWIELEYVEPRGAVPPQAVDELYAFLEKSRLFIIDYKPDNFIPFNGRLKMVDLESLFPIEGTIDDTINKQLRNPKYIPYKREAYDSHEKQKAALKRSVCR